MFQPFFLINSTEAASTVITNRRENRSLFSRLLSYVCCCSVDEATVVPLNDNPYCYYNKLRSNSGDEEELKSTQRIVSDRTPNRIVSQNVETERKDLLSGLSVDFIAYIIQYLRQEDQIQLRSCNKALLETVGSARNNEYMQNFRPRITMGYEIFDSNKLAGMLLAPYVNHLKALLNREYVNSRLANGINAPRITAEEQKDLAEIALFLRKINDFDGFMMMAIFFYFQLEPVLSWHIIEAAVKAGIYQPKDLNFLPNYDLQTIFEKSCELGLERLNQLLLEHHLKELKLFEGILKSFQSRNYRIYEKLVIIAKDERLLTDAHLHRMAEEAAQTYHSEFLKCIYENFPHLNYQNSNCIFIAIRIKNLQTLHVILEYRGNSDLLICNGDGLSAFDLAARNDFWQGIQLMAHTMGVPFCNIYTNAMRVAIVSDSTKSFTTLMEEITNHGPFYTFISKRLILRFINYAFNIKNLDIARSILKNSPTDILWHKEVLGAFDEVVMSLYLNPIFHTVQMGYLDGFLLLINFFGLKVLELRDSEHRTPILFAAHCGNSVFVKLIAALNTKQILQKDANGNNLLHIALKSLPDPAPFIKEILCLDFDWDQQNNLGESAIDIFTDLPSISTEDLQLIGNKYMLKHMGK